MRHDVKVSDMVVAFTPHKLSDKEVADVVLKRAVAGAAFVGKWKKLVAGPCHINWEVELCLPAKSVRPIKPKLWFGARLEMTKNLYYQLN
jgi:hypothetical protein